MNNLLWSIFKPSQLILLGAVLTIICWRWPIGRWFGRATILLVVLLGLVPTGALLMNPLERRFAIPPDAARADGIIVLGGAELSEQSYYNRQPQVGSAGDRLTTFLMLAARYPEARLVHSGAYDSGVARALILGAGVDANRVRFEDQSGNTCESPRATHALVQPRGGERWLLVTSASHLPRAVACYRAFGWDVVPYPTDFRRGPSVWHLGMVDNLDDFDTAAHEWLGLAYYRLRGFTRELFPAPP